MHHAQRAPDAARTPAPRGRLTCFAVTTRNTQVLVGQPFAAAGSLRDGRYAWCHENPGPGEGAAGTERSVPPSRACTEAALA